MGGTRKGQKGGKGHGEPVGLRAMYKDPGVAMQAPLGEKKGEGINSFKSTHILGELFKQHSAVGK